MKEVLYNVPMNKRLYKNSKDGAFGGVLSGMSDYFGLDVVLWRIFFILFVLITGFFPGVLMYFVAWLIMPERPKVEPIDKTDYVVSE